MIVPTSRFWLLLAAGILLAVFGSVIPGLELLLIPYNIVLFIVLIVTGLVAKKWDFLRVTRKVDPIMSVRVPNLVRLEVENVSDSPLKVTVRDEPPQSANSTESEFQATIEPGRVKTLTYHVTPFERGAEEFHGTYIRFLAPLGLCSIQKKIENDEKVKVYPNVLAVKEFELLKQRGRLDLMGVRKSRVRGLGTEFESLKDYNEDDFRTIDWKASARKGRLVVRNFEQERNQGLVVCFDIGRHMLSEIGGVKKLDFALDSGLMLMHAAEREGDQIGLLVFDDEVRTYIAPKKGRAQVAAVLNAMHDLKAEPIESNPGLAFSYLGTKWKRRSLLVVFTDVENEDQARELTASLAQLRKHHLVLVVRVSDPKLRELKALSAADAYEVYKKSAALLYEIERQGAEDHLQSAGLQSLGSEPQDLSAALVSSYLKFKALNMI